MGDLFGGSTQTQVVQNSMPTWMEDFYKKYTSEQENLYNTAKNIYNSNADYQPYQGERVHGFTNDQLTSMNMLRDQLGVGANGGTAAGQDAMAAATARNTQAGKTWADMGGDAFRANAVQTQNFTGDQANAYMNPYRQNVIDNTVSEMERSNQRRMLADQGKATAAGAFGGSRHGIMDAERERDFDTVLGNTVGQLQDQAFTNAQQQFNTDQNRSQQTQTINQAMGLQAFNANRDQFNTDQARMMQSGQTAAQLGQQQQQMGFNDINALWNMGNIQQQFGQQNLNTAYNDFLTQKSWPYQNFQFLQGAMGGQAPSPSAFATQTTTSPGASPFSQLAGAGIAGLGVAGQLGWQPFG